MNAHEISLRLSNAVTTYDRRREGRKDYNRYALAHYLGRVQDIVGDIGRGADPRAAIIRGFSGALCNVCLRALKLPVLTDADARGQTTIYRPLVPNPNEES